MTIFKCKMCGGSFEIANNETVATCEYCGTQQTLPKLDNERRANLYDRANHFRRNNEFDKAMGIYEQILNEDTTDAEAYWSLVLCRYGIEYVEDPTLHKRIPTVNRAQFTAVFDDDNYKSALQYSDSYQRTVYEKEAKAINEIQKGILEISQNEEPFDVFICYKETDNNGRRTQDSVLANELYHQLTHEGFKVFFSRITLEDKLGTAYEPYIFAALNSAKVMVVLGTKPEYFKAVWVRNEWSRFLSLFKQGQKKILIPAYRDMDPYDLPEEFSHLQAQDMSKLGFMQDLIRGIKKIVQLDKPQATVVKENAVSGGNVNIESLLKRVFMFLEDGEWTSANEYCEKVLDIEPENAMAYLGKLMAELKVRKKEKLKDCANSFEERNSYKKVIRFADGKLKSELEGYIEHINVRNENTRIKRIYDDAKKTMNFAKNEESYKKAAELFESINEYEDSVTLAEECRIKAEMTRKEAIYSEASKGIHSENIKTLEESIMLFKKIPTWKDSNEKIKECVERIEEIKINNECARKDKIYISSCENAAKEDIALLEKAIDGFKSISGWRDSDRKIEECRNKIVSIQKQLEEERIRQKQKEEEEHLKEEERKKKAKRVCLISAIVTVVLVVICFIVTTVVIPKIQYKNALNLIDKKEYKEAYKILMTIDEYIDVNELKTDLLKELVTVNTLDAGIGHTVSLRVDGTVVATGRNGDGQCDVEDWKDIMSVSAGYSRTFGVKKDGTVKVIGNKYIKQSDIDNWEDILVVCSGDLHVVGLKSNGTVVANGVNLQGQCDIEDWEDIVAISAGYNHTIGLRADGTVVATGSNEEGECDVEDWKDIVAISAGSSHTVGLKADGTVVATGKWHEGQCYVKNWNDIVAISAGTYHTIGLKSDGTVVSTMVNANAYNSGQCDVEKWNNIVAISAGQYHTIGLKSDGTVVATGYRDDGACDVEGWTNIQLPKK